MTENELTKLTTLKELRDVRYIYCETCEMKAKKLWMFLDGEQVPVGLYCPNCGLHELFIGTELEEEDKLGMMIV